jgi:outer membrane protein assembly factor BamB
VVYCTGLENRRAERPRGFESYSLRHFPIAHGAGPVGFAPPALPPASEKRITSHMLLRPLLALASLAVCAHAADWPRFLGPADNCTTPESGLVQSLPQNLPILWEMEKGEGMGGPAIAGESLFIFHRRDENEVVECRNASTGAAKWTKEYPAPYRPRYGGGHGPRTGPVFAEGRVFTFGVSGILTAFDAGTGAILWQRDCVRDFEMQPAFFGHGSTPLVVGNRLIVQIGGKESGLPLQCAALDVATGKKLWTTTHEWGASYASPIAATIHGRECVLVFAGGMSRPPTGGLLVIETATGKVLASEPHRADIAESVNASTPAVVSGNRIFVSEAYTAGGLCIEIGADFSTKVAWRDEMLGFYWMTPLVRDGAIFGVSGMNERLAEFTAHDVATGKPLWRDDLGGSFGRASILSTGDGVLCLGESGDLAWLELSRKGAKILSQTKLFHAPESWTLPALSGGRLYVSQNEPGNASGKRRLICYDLRHSK